MFKNSVFVLLRNIKIIAFRNQDKFCFCFLGIWLKYHFIVILSEFLNNKKSMCARLRISLWRAQRQLHHGEACPSIGDGSQKLISEFSVHLAGNYTEEYYLCNSVCCLCNCGKGQNLVIFLSFVNFISCLNLLWASSPIQEGMFQFRGISAQQGIQNTKWITIILIFLLNTIVFMVFIT